MKQMFVRLILCLALSSGSVAIAQQLSLKVTANSAVVTDGRIELKDQKRIQWFVNDAMPYNAGYAYEFGPVYLVAANGDKVELKAKEVMNGPVFHYSVSKHWLAQYPQGFVLQLGAVTRHNPDHSHEELPFSQDDLKLKVVPVAQ
jgi:hypothetical protein